MPPREGAVCAAGLSPNPDKPVGTKHVCVCGVRVSVCLCKTEQLPNGAVSLTVSWLSNP